MEILLALAIMGLLAGIALVNFGAWRGTQSLQEGAQRVETALRMARAEAANRGRRLQVVFRPEDNRVLVLWEPDPLTEPGKFVEYTVGTWRNLIDTEGVRVERCDYVGASLYRTLEATAVMSQAEQSPLAAITFEPNGSSDSVVIELASTDASEDRRAVIQLDGLTGTVSSRLLTIEEMETEAAGAASR